MIRLHHVPVSRLMRTRAGGIHGQVFHEVADA